MRLSRANSKAIKHACMKFHYAKCVPQVQYGYNVYNDDNEWCGTICYGGGAIGNIASPFGLNQGEVLELVRVALNGKQESTSKAVALSLRQLKKDDPLVKAVISYSDHRQRHVGTIYQATNWIYLGKIDPGDMQYFYKGKWTHSRTLNHLPKDKRDELKRTLPQRTNASKFKYLYCFDKKMRREYLKMAMPYPKECDITECDMQLESRRLSK